MENVEWDLYELLLDNHLLQYAYALSHSNLRISDLKSFLSVPPEDLEARAGLAKSDVKRLRKCVGQRSGRSTLGRKFKSLLHDKPLSDSKLSLNSFDAVFAKVAFDASSLSNYLYGNGVSDYANWVAGRFREHSVAYWNNHSGKHEVFLKRFSIKSMLKDVEHFLKTVAVWQFLDDEHILRTFGFVIAQRQAVCLNEEVVIVQEHATRSLRQLLYSKRHDGGHDVLLLCSFANQIAAGMAYLERLCICHGNLTLDNVLVFPNNVLKISDPMLFSVLKSGPQFWLKPTNFDPAKRQELCYSFATAAPSVLEHQLVNTESDIWSFGVVVWQIFSYGSNPLALLCGADYESQPIDVLVEQLLRVRDEYGSLLSRPEVCPILYHQLLASCWQTDVQHRLTFGAIVCRLDTMQPAAMLFAKEQSSYKGPKALSCKLNDVLIVLDRRPSNVSDQLALAAKQGSREVGLFCYNDANMITDLAQHKATRVVKRPPQKLNVHMIGKPLDDIRHNAHVGFDGQAFGAVQRMADEAARATPHLSRRASRDSTTMVAPARPTVVPILTDSDDFQLDLGPSLVDEVLAALRGVASLTEQLPEGPDGVASLTGADASCVTPAKSTPHTATNGSSSLYLTTATSNSKPSGPSKRRPPNSEPPSAPTASRCVPFSVPAVPSLSAPPSNQPPSFPSRHSIDEQRHISPLSAVRSPASGVVSSTASSSPLSSLYFSSDTGTLSLSSSEQLDRQLHESQIYENLLDQAAGDSTSSWASGDTAASMSDTSARSVARSSRMSSFLPQSTQRAAPLPPADAVAPVPSSMPTPAPVPVPIPIPIPIPTPSPALAPVATPTRALPDIATQPSPCTPLSAARSAPRPPPPSIPTVAPGPVPSATVETAVVPVAAKTVSAGVSETSGGAAGASSDAKDGAATSGSKEAELYNFDCILSAVKMPARQLGLTFSNYGDRYWSSATDAAALRSCRLERPVGAGEASATLQSVFGDTLSATSSVQVLQECKLSGSWNVARSVKLLKLRQLLFWLHRLAGIDANLLLGYSARCKELLIEASWDVPKAFELFSAPTV